MNERPCLSVNARGVSLPSQIEGQAEEADTLNFIYPSKDRKRHFSKRNFLPSQHSCFYQALYLNQLLEFVLSPVLFISAVEFSGIKTLDCIDKEPDFVWLCINVRIDVLKLRPT